VETLAQFDYFNTQAMVKLKSSGVQFKEFPEDVISALKQATVEVMDELADANPQFKTVRESYEAFLTPATQYSNLFQGAVYRQRS